MNPFEQYLQEHNIEPLRLSVAAGVRYLTVYNAMSGKPISALHEKRLRGALYQLTGEVFIGNLPVLEEQISEQQTQKLYKITRLR